MQPEVMCFHSTISWGKEANLFQFLANYCKHHKVHHFPFLKMHRLSNWNQSRNGWYIARRRVLVDVNILHGICTVDWDHYICFGFFLLKKTERVQQHCWAYDSWCHWQRVLRKDRQRHHLWNHHQILCSQGWKNERIGGKEVDKNVKITPKWNWEK